MKGLYFAKPIEYRVETPAERLTQGERFEGTCTATLRGGGPVRLPALTVALAYGEFKAVKADPAQALQIVETRRLAGETSLQPGETVERPWDFTLAPDCPITSKTGSLFLLYGGDPAEPGARGQLDLRVELSPVLEAFVATVENRFAFAAGERKAADGMTEVRFKPPRTYPTLEQMHIRMRYGDDGMDLEYRARLKGLGRGQSGGVKSRQVTLSRHHDPAEVLIGGKHPNRNLFRDTFQGVLAELVPSLFQEP